jgi:hypothetical protein
MAILITIVHVRTVVIVKVFPCAFAAIMKALALNLAELLRRFVLIIMIRVVMFLRVENVRSAERLIGPESLCNSNARCTQCKSDEGKCAVIEFHFVLPVLSATFGLDQRISSVVVQGAGTLNPKGMSRLLI